MIYKVRNTILRFLFIFTLFAFSQTLAFGLIYPDAITSFSGGATYCQDATPVDLSVTFSTCTITPPQSANIVVTWYSNTINSTLGGTQVAQTSSNTLTTTYTYTPSTLFPGTLYYYVVISWESSGDPACGDDGVLFSSTQEVVVNTNNPSIPAYIFGNTPVPEVTSGLSYAVSSQPDATIFTWTVPVGWTITEGQGTTSIIVTSGTLGQDGDISVTAGNSCGTSEAAVLVVTVETPLDHGLYGCSACHIQHDALGGSLTNTLGNSNLCLSCHVTSGAASSTPFANEDKAIPGTSGNSHSWDVPSVNSTYETVLTTDPDMLLRVDEGNITCSTCHDQHNGNTLPYYTRISNVGDFMCKDCHSPRNVGRYLDNTGSHRGSHPVGLAYSGESDLEPVPTGSVIVVDGNVECSSCHMTHYAATSDGYLLRQANDNILCTSCHLLGTHNGMECSDCHLTHNTDKSNIYMIRNTIITPNSGARQVVFTALIGTNSFADGDATYDGVCEVCHTNTIHYRNDGSASDQDHTSSGGPMDGLNCIACHPHNETFTPTGCDDCHNVQAPTFGSTVHVKHKDTYGYACSTCHFQYGSG